MNRPEFTEDQKLFISNTIEQFYHEWMLSYPSHIFTKLKELNDRICGETEK